MEIDEVEYNENGDIIDYISGSILKTTPGEKVRQKFLKILNMIMVIQKILF